MFKSKLDKQKIQKITQDLINGGSLSDVATNNNVSYQHACYFRKKLVKAGALIANTAAAAFSAASATPVFNASKAVKRRR